MIENRRVKNFFKLRACTKFLRPIQPTLVKNYNFGSNFKIGNFWPNMAIWFADYNGKRITDKKCGLRRFKTDTYTKK